MKTHFLKILWGIIFIFLAGLTLASLEGYVPFDGLTGELSLIIFVCLSSLSFLSYFLHGTRHWAWLFPALLCASMALNAAGVFSAYGTPIAGFPILLSLAIPLYIGYFIDRKQWGLLIPAWLLTIIIVTPTLIGILDETLLIAMILYSISLPFLVGCLTTSNSKWAQFIAAFFGLVGVFYIAESIMQGAIWGPAILLFCSIPFYVLSSRSQKNRWALIPAGTLTSIGVVAILNRLLPAYDYISVANYQLGAYTSLLFLGLSITFAMTWRLRTHHRYAWTRYPTAGFLLLALLAFFTGESFTTAFPFIVFILVGAAIMVDSTLKAKVNRQPSP
jgi:hypothetical protein